MRSCRATAALLACLAALASFTSLAAYAASVPIDGRLDADYGAARSVQVNATDRGDTPPPPDPVPPYAHFLAQGSELDNAYGFVSEGTLYLFFGGNLKHYQGEPLIFPDVLNVFIDSAPGGQNVLRADNPAAGDYLTLQMLAGLRFDADFAPDYWFAVNTETYLQPVWVYGSTLPADAGGAGGLLGRADATGPGTLSGGTNPYGVLASFDMVNGAGVGGTCGSSSGDGVTTGVEFAIPLAAIGDPHGPISICAFVGYDAGRGEVSNQVLGTLPAGTCAGGPASATDFSAVPGAQYFTIDTTVPARATSWGRLKQRYR